MIRSITALMLLATPAVADEIWNLPTGKAIYEADIGETAIFSVPYEGGRANMYIDGLGGNYRTRGYHEGYWMGNGAGTCSAQMIGPDGFQTYNWGRINIIFDNSEGFTGWTAYFSNCFAEPTEELRAEPY